MPWATPLVNGQTTGVSTFSEQVADDVRRWKGPVDAGYWDLANARNLQADALFLRGQLMSGYPFVPVSAVPTSNPQVWNVTMRDYAGTPVVKFGTDEQPLANYSISGLVARPGFANPGFESGLASWAVSCGITVTTVNPDAGTHCASIADAGANLTQIITGLTSGTSYTITARVRGDTGTSTAAVLSADDGTGAAVVTGSVTLTSSWANNNIVFVANSTGNVRITLKRGPSGTGNAYFDSIVFFGPAIVNGGFESGLTGWTASEFGISTVNPHSGANSLFLNVPGYIYQAIGSGLVSGLSSRITVFVRGDSGTSGNVTLTAHNGLGTNFQGGSATPITTLWQPAVMDYVADMTGAIAFSSNWAGTGTVYIDDASITSTYAPSLWAITFAAGCQPFAGELVTLSGSLSL